MNRRLQVVTHRPRTVLSNTIDTSLITHQNQHTFPPHSSPQRGVCNIHIHASIHGNKLQLPTKWTVYPAKNQVYQKGGPLISSKIILHKRRSFMNCELVFSRMNSPERSSEFPQSTRRCRVYACTALRPCKT